MVRLILFGLFFYLIYFLVKYMFLKPFKEGYGSGRERNKQNTWGNPFRTRKEGEVTITYKPEENHKDNKKVGEYIDYEELKEE